MTKQKQKKMTECICLGDGFSTCGFPCPVHSKKLPHPKNCVYDLYTGLCDYCGKQKVKKKKDWLRDYPFTEGEKEQLRFDMDYLLKEQRKKYLKEIKEIKNRKFPRGKRKWCNECADRLYAEILQTLNKYET